MAEQLNGWIALHRQFLGWEWYKDPVTKAVFLHLLIKAAWKDGTWNGVPIKRGQVIIGRRTLAKELGLSERQVRTALDHLEATHEVTREATHLWTRINISNFNEYQDIGATQSTHEVPHESTTSKQYITINNKNKSIYISELVDYLNAKCNKKYRVTKAVSSAISQLQAEGYTLEECKRVVDVMSDKWLGTKYEPGLAPKSLFKMDNFDSYLNESRPAVDRNQLAWDLCYLQIKYNEEGLTDEEQQRMEALERELSNET